MKPTLLIATLSMVFASPSAFAKSELETLRSLCQEQKRQINELEVANERLRSDRHESPAVHAKSETVSSEIAKPAAVAKSPATPTASATTYAVKAGDNLVKIASKVGTNPQKLAKLNGIKTTSILQLGQKLKVPGTTAASNAPATAAVAATPATPSTISGKTHLVETGDTLFSISKKHGISTEAIVSANPKVKPSALRPGQVVNLGGGSPATTLISAPAHAKTPPAVEKASSPSPALDSAPAHEAAPATSSAPATANKPAPATALAPAMEKAAPTPEKKIRPVLIEAEMTYGEFAIQHGTNAERLNALNGLDLTTATVLAKGSELYVPAQP